MLPGLEQRLTGRVCLRIMPPCSFKLATDSTVPVEKNPKRHGRFQDPETGLGNLLSGCLQLPQPHAFPRGVKRRQAGQSPGGSQAKMSGSQGKKWRFQWICLPWFSDWKKKDLTLEIQSSTTSNHKFTSKRPDFYRNTAGFLRYRWWSYNGELGEMIRIENGFFICCKVLRLTAAPSRLGICLHSCTWSCDKPKN